MRLSLQSIAKIIGAHSSSERSISTLITDSRALCDPSSTLFFALKTSSNDGHNYIPQLYRRGVRAFVVEFEPQVMKNVEDAQFLVVPNPLDALQSLASHVRELFTLPVVGITGSRGKTIVKELVYTALLKAGWKVVRSPRSWNSQIGVPLSLWELNSDSEIALIEAGIDKPGQMDALARMIQPNLGVLTYINSEHDAGFSSRDEKLIQKKLLFKDSLEVLEGSDNRALAAQILETLGEDTHLLDGIDEVSTRLDVRQGVNNCMTIFDEFTADAESLDGALDFMCRRKTASRRNTLIIGNLLHRKGASPNQVYAKVAQLVTLAGVDRVICIGKEIGSCAHLFDPLVASEFFDSVDDFLAALSPRDFNGELILIKGQRHEGFDLIRNMLETPRHQSILEVNLDAVVHNFNVYKSLIPHSTGIVAMVKASAYGVGAIELAKTLQSHGASYLAVAVIEEAVSLRKAGITMPIMVLNPVSTNCDALFSHRLEPVVFSLEELSMLMEEAKRKGLKHYPVHLKLETGMRRLGFTPEQLPELVAFLNAGNTLKVATAFSHLSTADCLGEDEYTQGQFHTFAEMTDTLAKALPYSIKRHILNSAGIMRFPEQHFDMVRLGIGLYGLSPLPPTHTQLPLRPVAKLCTTIISLKHWPKGTSIGYGRRGRLTHDSVIATLPIGYADGLDRRLGCGAASFAVNGAACPTVGNICMDLCMIDVTGVDVKVGDSVEIFGPTMPVEKLAETLQTIPYEIISTVSPRIHRVYYRE